VGLKKGRPVTLVRVKPIWRCAEPRCPRTWTEISEPIRARASLTERVRGQACRRVGEEGHDVAAVAVGCGVRHTIMRAVQDHGRRHNRIRRLLRRAPQTRSEYAWARLETGCSVALRPVS
jgi:hypothetical protein